jgi:hypothetical protein
MKQSLAGARRLFVGQPRPNLEPALGIRLMLRHLIQEQLPIRIDTAGELTDQIKHIRVILKQGDLKEFSDVSKSTSDTTYS